MSNKRDSRIKCSWSRGSSFINLTKWSKGKIQEETLDPKTELNKPSNNKPTISNMVLIVKGICSNSIGKKLQSLGKSILMKFGTTRPNSIRNQLRLCHLPL